ncbi:sensor histidine kinase [Candidatus Avoscillospira sp. LCP25S3_F1]|uniref:sensor histidine kinase n=1 Tax=Candidatus Avoscillospira sp. LCP25S3_F1 TaxID=3438825 RepID=UPI003F917766
MNWFSKSEPAAEAAAAHTKIPLTHRLWAKVVSFLLVILMIPTFLGTCLGIFAMWTTGVYTMTESAMLDTMLENVASGVAYDAANALVYETTDHFQNRWINGNIASLEANMTGERTGNFGIVNGGAPSDHTYSYEWIYVEDDDTGEKFITDADALTDQGYASDSIKVSHLSVTITLPNTFTFGDEFYLVSRVVRVLYTLRVWAYPLAAVSLMLSIASLVFLLCATGKRRGVAEIQPGWGTFVPADVLTAATLFAGFLGAQIMVEATYGFWNVPMMFLFTLGFLFLEVISLGWLMSITLRLKLHTLWANTIIYRVLRLGYRLLRKLLHGGSLILRGTPTMKKTVAIAVGVVLVDGFFTAATAWGGEAGWWFFRSVIFLAVVVLLTLSCRRLYDGGKALAEGDLNHQISLTHLYGPLKDHAEHLNAIGEGMTAAVEQRMRSERMKTELITNVSHDIKTPLTSIINYTDLIEKEPCDNAKITEYAEVLHRQSDRLKRLIEDLVEASKASTGNLEVQMAPCTVNILLGQALAEYEEKLSSSQLELMTGIEKNLEILADGRRLWRVFDNLMNNICKYAQPHTRVYVTARPVAGRVEIAFKNISNVPLNLTAEELMERFVRGDESRHSEGNGLGLSIARSLTELQNGRMELSVDGDLFKVVLTFPLLSKQ